MLRSWPGANTRVAGGSCHRGCPAVAATSPTHLNRRPAGCAQASGSHSAALAGSPGATHPTILCGSHESMNGRFMRTLSRMRRSLFLLLVCAVSPVLCSAGVGWGAEGTMTWGVHVWLKRAFFAPAGARGASPPLMGCYALRDARDGT